MKNTTPDVVELQSLLAYMKTAGMTHAVMEVSSHALAQNRVFGCEFDTAVFSNMTQDHLDFHGNLENYQKAKGTLFESLCKEGNLKQGKTAVVNIDDPAGLFMLDRTTANKITYSVQRPADIRATEVKIAANGASFHLTGVMGDFSVSTKLTGFFNVYNLMAAAGAAYAEGVPVDIIREVMGTVSRVPGRFERVEINMPYDVIVDYAHTPDGLENVLKTAKEFVRGRLIVVFGCGGDRDRTKRPIMGRIATVYADRIIVTSDNPRSEDPERIIAEIVAGITEASPRSCYEAVSDRKAAIKLAMSIADAGDVILIAGKGHENYQILGTRTIHFDDCEVVLEVLEEMK
jgi:UDP-N-acetylmuramyl-tripeptide synthetase